MGEAAVAAARAVGYVGAGTVEFVADADGFFFLEMNTRLQVEHPVTEMVTGFDLVEWQLRVAAGERLPVDAEATSSCTAMPSRRASTPRTRRATSPPRSAGWRCSACRTRRKTFASIPASRPATRVSIHYDAMLAKLIVHGATRDQALALLRRALASCDVVGVASNLDLLHRIASHPAFAEGGIDTGFIARHGDALLAGQGMPPDAVLAAAALGVLTDEVDAAAAYAAASADPWSPWHACDHWWPNMAPARVLEFHAGDTVFAVRLQRDAAAWRLTIGERCLRGTAARDSDGRLRITLDGAHHHVLVSRDGENVSVRWQGETFRFVLPDPIAHAEEEDASGGRLVAPLPGQVTQVATEPGAAVTRGQVLVVLEAMKTVFRLAAPADGVVEHVSCMVGETVQEGQVLISFVEADEA